MIDKNYRDKAINTYGEACEICGHRSSLEVHHINYQEHQEIENKLRKANNDEFIKLTNEAKLMGFDSFSSKTHQLSKDDSTLNTSVLCGNCHTLVHTMDVGLKLLKAIKPRK